MQGRLVAPVGGRIQCFPASDWRHEFPNAAAAGLARIEWIYESFGVESNPICTDEGVEEMLRLSSEHGVEVKSLCADYFMEKPLLRAAADDMEARLQTLAWLMGRCCRLGMERVVLPFVDASRIQDDGEMRGVANRLRRALITSEETSVEIHLETSLGPSDFSRMLEMVPHPLLKVNYDSGNSASLNYSVTEEFEAYGPRVGSVHIKDRVAGGGTVPLGEGDVDFEGLAASLDGISYQGDLVLQVARGREGEEVEWARSNLRFVRSRALCPTPGQRDPDRGSHG